MRIAESEFLGNVSKFSIFIVIILLMHPSSQGFAANSARNGRLTARPAGSVKIAMLPGIHPLHISESRDGLLFIPQSYNGPSRPAPLVILFHGNQGDAENELKMLQLQAENSGTVLLVPESRKRTWDRVIDRKFGPDADYVNQALQFVFENVVIDFTHIAIAGFSDGASYALSLGLTNGDLFTHIAAFSPGSAQPRQRSGLPLIFISAGTSDSVLPIDKCARVIVPKLRNFGYDILYTEFDGEHEVPESVREQMMSWFLER